MEEQYVYKVYWSWEFISTERYILEKKTDKSVVVWEGACKKTHKIHSLDQSFFFNREEAVEFALEKAKVISNKLKNRLSRLDEFIKNPTFSVIERYDPIRSGDIEI